MITARRILDLFPSCAGLLGVAGIAVSAAAAHRGGGSAAANAGTFLLLHAAALLGLSTRDRPDEARRFATTGSVMAVGVVLFAGDPALAGLLDWRPLPLAAPLGGMLMIAGWVILPLWAVARAIGRRPAGG